MNLTLDLASCNDGGIDTQEWFIPAFCWSTSNCFSEVQKEMLPIVLELGLGRKEGEEQNLPWGMKNMENEIEQTEERLTAGACWIYCY